MVIIIKNNKNIVTKKIEKNKIHKTREHDMVGVH